MMREGKKSRSHRRFCKSGIRRKIAVIDIAVVIINVLLAAVIIIANGEVPHLFIHLDIFACLDCCIKN
jgi:hypothetical protein